MSIPPITSLPTPPSRSDDSATFVSRADAFVAAMAAMVAELNAAFEAIAEEAGAINYNATSSSSVAIGTGSKSFTIETGKLLQIGQFVLIAYTASPSDYMFGQVTAHNSVTGALTVNVTSSSGSGTFAAWTISLSASTGTAGTLNYDTDDALGANSDTRVPTQNAAKAYVDTATTAAIATAAAATAAAIAALGTASTLTKDTDTTLAANSDARAATQKAVKAYVDAAVTGLLDFKGSTNCSANPNYPAASKGDAYVVSTAGKIGGASGASVDVGDVYVASADNAGGTQASVGTSWFVLEHNLAGVALLDSPTFINNPTAPTQAAGDADTSIATTAFVDRLRDVPVAASLGERGAMHIITAGVTLDTGLAATTSFLIYNNSGSDIVITQGSGLTLRLDGTATTGNRTLLKRGRASVSCISTTEYVIGGSVT